MSLIWMPPERPRPKPAERVTRSGMVCSSCLKRLGGWEKCCSHGVIPGGGFRTGACSDCGHEVDGTKEDHLHCPERI